MQKVLLNAAGQRWKQRLRRMRGEENGRGRLKARDNIAYTALGRSGHL
jgi:hypothetical protein